ncbi:hypothetical protein, partial [Aeromonas veronii]|uniref:hypothetical protein n=1 Tax=Aeromonas veronii TaxID=654 RepID=UPI0030068A6F
MFTLAGMAVQLRRNTQQSSSELSHVNGNLGGVAAALSTTRDYLQSIDAKLANIGSGSSSGVPSSVASDVAGIASMMGASLNMMSSIQGNTNGLNNKLDDISGNTKATSYFAKDMKDSLKNIERSLGGGGSGSGSDGGSSAWVIPPFFGALKSRGHAACAKRCFGV